MSVQAILETVGQTESDALPIGWKWLRLGAHVSKIGSGVTPRGGSASYQTTGIPLIRSQNVHTSRFDPTGLAFISDEQDAAMAGSRVCPGDVLLNITGASIGRVCVVPSELCPANVNQHVSIIRCNGEIASDYLAFYLAQRDFQKSILESQAGATRQALTKELIQNFRIAAPPLAEQKRIAGILREQLAAVQLARAAAAAQLEAAKGLPAAYLRDVFEGHEASSWPRQRIGEYAKVQSGYAFKSDWFVDDGIRLLRNANVFQNQIEWNDVVCLPESRRSEFVEFELAVGDIVLTLDRPVVNNGLKVARLSPQDVPALLLQRVGRFRLRANIDSSFLFAFLNSPRFIDQITAHDQSLGVPHVSPKQVEAVEFPVPNANTQRKVAGQIERQWKIIRGLRESTIEQLEAIDAMPAALLRAAFQGQL